MDTVPDLRPRDRHIFAVAQKPCHNFSIFFVFAKVIRDDFILCSYAKVQFVPERIVQHQVAYALRLLFRKAVVDQYIFPSVLQQNTAHIKDYRTNFLH